MIADALAKALHGRKCGSGWIARCPAHDDRHPSLSISERDGKLLVHCHAGCSQESVWQSLKGMARVGRDNPRQVPKAPVRPSTADRGVKTRIASAKRIWSECRLVADTPVERYLASRGITMKPPPTIRFHPGLKHGPTGLLLPAMVAAVTVCPGDEIVAIHRTFLKADGSGKAPITQNKMMLGPCAGGAVRLAASGDELVLAEGLETAMSVLQATGKPTWATLSTSGLKAVRLPPEARKLIIAADGDQPGEDAAMIAADRIVAEGRRVKIARPPWGLDFNDLLRAEGLATLAALAGGGRDI